MKKLEFASTDRIYEHQKAVDELMLHVAAVMKDPEETEEEWLRFCFVSDECRLADFFSAEELVPFGERIGISNLKLENLLCDVTIALHQRKSSPPRVM